MNIRVQNSLFGTKDENAFSIIKGTPLACAFRVGDQDCITLLPIGCGLHIQMAYKGWLQSMIRQQVSYITDELDRIAYHLIDHGHVTLSCTCNSEYCHGYIIKTLLEKAL